MDILKEIGIVALTGIMAIFGFTGTPENLGGGPGTINQLDQWRATSSPVTAITQNVFGKDVLLSGLTPSECLELDANGVITTAGAACGSGGGGGGSDHTYPFPEANNGTSTALQLSGGFTAASSTIANLNTNYIIATSTTEDTALHSTLYVDSSASSVGIGTASPSNNLHVLDTTAGIVDLAIESTGGGLVEFNMNTNRNSGVDWKFQNNGNTFNFIPSSDANFRVQSANASFVFRVNTAADTDAFFINTGATEVNVDEIDYDFIVNGLAQSSLFHVDGGNNRVGIGTASPSKELHVVRGAGSLPSLGSQIGLFQNNSLTTDSSVFGIIAGTSGLAGIQFGDSGAINRGQILYDHANDDLALYTSQLERLTIASDGDVGIGIASPRSRLNVYDNVDNTPTTLTIENGDTTIETAQQVNNLDFYTNDASSSGTGVSARISHIAENAGNQYSLAFSTYSLALAEAMRIDQSGQIGIGTTDPAQILHVVEATNPTIRLNETATPASYFEIGHQGPTQTTLNAENNGAGSALIDFNPMPSDGTSTASFRFFRATNTTGTVGFSIHAGDGSATTNTFFGGNTDSYLNSSTGSVGIGTVSPGAKLEVDVSGTGDVLRLDRTDANGFLEVDFTTQWTNFNSQSDYVFSFSGTEAVRFDDGGNVGIGTSTPARKLSVSGLSYFGDGTGTGTSTFDHNLEVFGNLQVGTGTTNISGTATSTFGGGIDLTGGCIAVNGTCVSGGGGGGGSGTVTSSTDRYATFYDGTGTTVNGTTTLQFQDGLLKFNESADPNLDFALEGANFANAFYFDSSANSVGIKTSTPSRELEVNGDFEADNWYSFGGLVMDYDSPGDLVNFGAVSGGGTADDSLALYAGTSEQMRITPGGNIGFGTTTPLYRFTGVQPSGDGFYTMFSTSGTKAGITLAERVTGQFGYSIYHDGSLNGLAMTVTDSVGDPRGVTNFFLDRGGELGLNGSVSPVSAVEIAGAKDPSSGLGSLSNYTLGLRNSAATVAGTMSGIAFVMDGFDDNNISSAITSEVAGGGNGQGRLHFYTKQSTVDGVAPDLALTINESGFLGVGTSTPSSLLHVDSATSATTTVTIGSAGEGFGGCIQLRDEDDAGWTYITALNGTLNVSTTSCE